MQEGFVFNIELKKRKKKLLALDKCKTFIKPGMMSSLTPRSPIRSYGRLKRIEKSFEEGPEIVTIRATSKDLIPPFSIRSKDYAKISKEKASGEISLPRMPPSQIKLRPLKKKKKVANVDICPGIKSTFLRVTKLEYCKAVLFKNLL